MNRISSRTESIFEIIAGYFVDVHFNTLFVFAKNNSTSATRSTGASLTDIYRKTLNYYMMGTFKERDKYIQTVKDLFKYYTEITNNSMITFAEMVDVIVAEMVPEEYFEDLSGHQRDKILNDVIKRLVTWLNKKCSKDYITYIIDERSNVRLIQDATRDYLVIIREEYYVKFASTLIGGAPKNVVSIEVVDKIRAALAEQVRLKCDAIKERDKLNNLAVELRDRLRKANKEIKALTAQVEAASRPASYTPPVPSRIEQVYMVPVQDVIDVKSSVAKNTTIFEAENTEDDEDEEDDDEDELAEQRKLIERLRLERGKNDAPPSQ